jgi:hypothetical protein
MIASRWGSSGGFINGLGLGTRAYDQAFPQVRDLQSATAIFYLQ